MLVKQAMSGAIFICHHSDRLDQVAKRMWEGEFQVALVVDEAGRFTSLVTDHDICMAAFNQGKGLEELRVCEAVSQRQTAACHPEDPVDEARRLMLSQKLRKLPVIDHEGMPVGLISLSPLNQRSAETY